MTSTSQPTDTNRRTSAHGARAADKHALSPSSSSRRAIMLDAAVHRRAKAFAASEGLSLTAWATAAIRAALPADAVVQKQPSHGG